MIIAIASTNLNKMEEIRHKLSDFNHLELVPAASLADIGPIEEDGDSFEENALIKAREVARITGKISLADDSGLVVDSLGGEPGILSARYGNLKSDAEKNSYLLSRMTAIPEDKRSARFVCAVAVVLTDGREFTCRGECEGIITKKPVGESGFGYDPVFFIPALGRTMAELSMAEKNRISHRAVAIDKLHDLLRDFF